MILEISDGENYCSCECEIGAAERVELTKKEKHTSGTPIAEHIRARNTLPIDVLLQLRSALDQLAHNCLLLAEGYFGDPRKSSYGAFGCFEFSRPTRPRRQPRATRRHPSAAPRCPLPTRATHWTCSKASTPSLTANSTRGQPERLSHGGQSCTVHPGSGALLHKL